MANAAFQRREDTGTDQRLVSGAWLRNLNLVMSVILGPPGTLRLCGATDTTVSV